MTTTDLNALALQLAGEKKDNEYILGDEVRIECVGGPFIRLTIIDDAPIERYKQKGKDCGRCKGRGWYPLNWHYLSEWMEAAETVFPKVSVFKNLYTGKWHGHVNQLKGYECSKGKTPSEAFFLALSNAVRILSEEK